MKSFAVAALVLAVLASAQEGAPPCATACVSQTPTSCAASDISCLCHDQNFITKATQCILTTCKGSDLQAAETFAQQLCASVGVTLTSTPPIPSATGSDSSSSASTDTGSSTPSPSATSPSTASGASSTPSVAASGSPSGATSSSSSAASAAASSGAATEIQAGLTGLMGVLLALFTL